MTSYLLYKESELALEKQFLDDNRADRRYERTNCLVSELDLSSITLHFYSQYDGDDKFHTVRSTSRNKF